MRHETVNPKTGTVRPNPFMAAILAMVLVLVHPLGWIGMLVLALAIHLIRSAGC